MEKIVIMVLITLTMGQAKEDLDTMKEMMAEMKMEMMAEMNERLSLAEGKLAKTEDELAITKDELAITKDDHAITKARTDELEREVAILRAPPYIHSCGSNSGLVSGSSGTIPYTSLLYSSTNTEGGGLDISAGVFTAPHGGSYTVYWDISASLNSGNFVVIYLQKNGESIEESRHYSQYNGPSGNVYDQGGRTIVVYLGVGDTLQLYSPKYQDDRPGGIVYTTFCVSLTTPDLV